MASSWRNERQPEVVAQLGEAGHEVYDFRATGRVFLGAWTGGPTEAAEIRAKLNDAPARDTFLRHWQAMAETEACVLLCPCGPSAHLEAGHFVGASKPLFILLSDGEPELMYRMATRLCTSVGELVSMLKAWDPARRRDGAA